MPSVVLLEFDAVRSIRMDYTSKIVEIKGRLPVNVSMDVQRELYQLMDDDPLYMAKIVEAASNEYKSFVRAIVNDMKGAEKAGDKAPDVKKKNAIVKDFENGIRGHAARLEKDAIAASKKAHDVHLKTKSEYHKYANFKVGCKAKIAVDAVNIGVGAVGVMGAISTGGATLFFGIYKLFKAVVSIFREVYKLNRAAQKERDKIEKFLAKASKTYQEGKKQNTTGLKEFAKTFLNSATGIKFTNTIGDAVAAN